MDLGDDHMAPLEHHLASGPSWTPQPSLATTQATSGKCSVTHITLLQAPPRPKRVCLAPCTVGSANAPVVMGPPQAVAGRTPKVADYGQPPSDED